MKNPSPLRVLLIAAFCSATLAAQGPPESSYPGEKEGDFIIRDFHFKSGESLPELKLHYISLGRPQRDARGSISNAVLILHGTTGSGRNFLSSAFDSLFLPGQPLDADNYYVILPDSIGTGGSSKPSDGLRAHFPRYEYDDMIEAQYQLVTQGLGVHHLRLVMGISMGGMHTWLWGEQHPDFMDALLPLACAPAGIAGRNRMWRKMTMDAIRNDPQWKNGEYQQQPPAMKTVANIFAVVIDGPLHLYQEAPTRYAADSLLTKMSAGYGSDANNLLYQVDASRNYDPAPWLERIQAPLVAINAADDFINPPELGILEAAMKKVKRGRYVLLPIGPESRGHRTVGNPNLWKQYLAELLQQSATH
jgi:homoserine O-acetyltransferase